MLVNKEYTKECRCGDTVALRCKDGVYVWFFKEGRYPEIRGHYCLCYKYLGVDEEGPYIADEVADYHEN